MDINGTEMECSELLNALRRHIQKDTRQIIHAIINCNLRLCNVTFHEWIRSHYHDIYHLCYNKIRCNQCTLQYILPEHRQLQPRHLHSLFAEDLSNPRHNSGINIRSKDISINEIDIVLAGCLVDHFCDSVYWFYSLNLLGRTLEQFLDENKFEIYDLVDTRHVKSRGNRGITTDDTSHVKSRGKRNITTDETIHFKSSGNRGITTDDTNHAKSRGNRGFTTDDTNHAKSRGNRGITTDDTNHAKSRGNRGITTDDTNHAKSRGNRGITTDDTNHAKSRGNRGITTDDTNHAKSRGNRGFTTDDTNHAKSRGNRGITTDDTNHAKSRGNRGFTTDDTNHAKSRGNRGITTDDTNHAKSRGNRGITTDDTNHAKSRGNRGITTDDTNHAKSRGNRGITTDDTNHAKSRGNRGITTDEWVLLFGSDTNVFDDKDQIYHVSAKSNITVQHLYEANVLLPRNLLNNLCPFKKKVDRILHFAKMAINKECDWINIACKEAFTRTSDEILSWLQCCDIMIEQRVYSNGPEMFTENTDLNHDKKQFLEQSMFDHDADDDTKLCMGEFIDEYQQLDIENHENSKYNDGNLVFVQRTFTFKEEIDAILRLQFSLLRANKVLIPQEYELTELFNRCDDNNVTIPSDTFFKTPQQRLASFINWPFSKRYWPVQLAEAGFIYSGREWIVRCFMCNHISSVNTWIPTEKPEEAHARLNPTCNYVVDMNYKTCQTYKTVTNTISTKQLPDANLTSHKSVDMYQNKHADDIASNKHNQPNGCTNNLTVSNDFDNVFSPDAAFHIQYDPHGRLHENQSVKMSVDDLLNVCSDGMNDMVENQSTAIEVDDSDSTNEVLHPHEATIEVDCNVPVSDNTPGVVDTTEHNLVVSNDNVTARNGIASESTHTKHRLQNGDTPIKLEVINQIKYQENTVKFKYPAFESFRLRMKSFSDWPYTAKQRPDVLANAGYFYTGDADIVRCFCCDLGVAEWAHTDDVWVEHARHSSTCWFLKTQKGDEFIKDVQERWKKIYNPKHAVFEDRDSRLATYEGVWRPDIEQTPDILTDAGFFYTGADDVVRCHYCDGGLRNWESADDPWEEHARWFPFCKYIIKMKGKEYIDSVRRKYEVIERNEELVIESEGIFANHPFVQQLADLSFQTEDIKTAMRHFTQNEGHSNFTIEDLIEIIVEKNGQLQSAFSASNMQAITEPEERNPQKLREINKQLKESILCVRCKTNEISMLFPNCGHRVTCEKCAYQLKFCPHCQKKIKKRMKTFLS